MGKIHNTADLEYYELKRTFNANVKITSNYSSNYSRKVLKRLMYNAIKAITVYVAKYCYMQIIMNNFSW